MCRFRGSDLLRFYGAVLPFALLALATFTLHGREGLGWWPLWAWAGFVGLFFGVIETRILCRHCPFYAREGLLLRCPVNYGVPRLWRFRPGPMGTGEKALLAAGFLVFGLFPAGTGAAGALAAEPPARPLLAGLAAGTLVAALGLFLWLRRRHCPRCVNLSCFLNRVPGEVRRAYLARHPAIEEDRRG